LGIVFAFSVAIGAKISIQRLLLLIGQLADIPAATFPAATFLAAAFLAAALRRGGR
jgi:hypothetical protein